VKRPFWSLELVKRLANTPGGLFVQQTRASDFFESREAALAAVREVLENLTEQDFAHSVQLTYDLADVYGVLFKGGGWYLKLTVDQEYPEVAVISFHPLERPLRTNRGQVKP
jgi:hypothetical protein